MTPEGQATLAKLFAAGKVSDKLVTEVASWYLPQLAEVADRRFPDELMPLH